ncbi:hypothetical protein [Methylobacterium sp. Leaf99]|uniref:hypothetical protein n=1 Tax=Methylobacterium sp. Leaf99 TaxID=1736251 RepID=UPI000B0BB300|nr:hypothetical protein [Methylobacterium sp. Leaf99]
MADETLLTAARRVVRFIRIDEAHGGLLSNETVQAVDTLDKQVRSAAAAEEAAEIPMETAHADR